MKVLSGIVTHALCVVAPHLTVVTNTTIIPANLPSGLARQIGAKYGRGVHDDPPGVIGEHANGALWSSPGRLYDKRITPEERR